MKKLTIWFDRWSTGVIGVIDNGNDRTLIHDDDTIATIETKLRFMEGTL